MKMESEIKTVSFYTLGCKLNQSETDALRQEFIKRGYIAVPFKDSADLTVINTCTVTNQADAKSRNIIRQAVKASPSGKIAVVGCYSQVSSTDLAQIPGVHLILGTREKFKIFDHLHDLRETQPLIFLDEDHQKYEETTFLSSGSRTRAFLKIQDGCDYHCTYCIIPTARGSAQSRKFENGLQEAKDLVSKGFKELILTGINLGTYQDGEKGLTEFIQSLEKIEGLERIRISSIEVNTLSDDLVRYISKSQKVMPHFHLPLQAGSDYILKPMGRKYRCQEFKEKVYRIRALTPDASIGTDIIVGFPGETDELYQETLAFLKEISFSYMHIFRYSIRKNTPAEKLENQVNEAVKKARAQELKQLSQRFRERYALQFLDKTVNVLWEISENGTISGWSPHYVRVTAPGSSDWINTISDVMAAKSMNGQLLGRIM